MLIRKRGYGSIEAKVIGAMRIASPTFRIATGLLLAVLLSAVGYQVFRQSNFYAPD